MTLQRKIESVKAIFLDTSPIMRGKYGFLKTMDAIQVAAALMAGSNVFVTNDNKLKSLNEIDVLLLSEYV